MFSVSNTIQHVVALQLWAKLLAIFQICCKWSSRPSYLTGPAKGPAVGEAAIVQHWPLWILDAERCLKPEERISLEWFLILVPDPASDGWRKYIKGKKLSPVVDRLQAADQDAVVLPSRQQYFWWLRNIGYSHTKDPWSSSPPGYTSIGVYDQI